MRKNLSISSTILSYLLFLAVVSTHPRVGFAHVPTKRLSLGKVSLAEETLMLFAFLLVLMRKLSVLGFARFKTIRSLL